MSGALEFKVPIKKYKQLVFGFGAASVLLGCLILSLPVVALFNSDFQFPQEFLGCTILFPVIFMYTMWFLFGYEKMILYTENVELVKSNRIFTNKKVYPTSDIESIQVVEKKFKTDKWTDVVRERLREKQRAFPFWIKMGQLKLITKTGEVTFFNGLSSSQTVPMLKKIEIEIQKRKHNIDLT